MTRNKIQGGIEESFVKMLLRRGRISRAAPFMTALLLCVMLTAFVPRAAAAGKNAKRAVESSVVPAGEVAVILNEQFLNAVLEGILTQETPPTFPLGAKRNGAKCASEIMLPREVRGKRTAVNFNEGKITAPVAFRGSYDAAPFGCLNFEGWADTNFKLDFDQSKQVLVARVEVRDVHLSRIPSFLSGGVTGMVQEAIDRRVNPVEILRAEQLAARLPLTPDKRLRAREVRHEVIGKELRLRIFYEIVRGG